MGKLVFFLNFLQQIDVEQKLKDAPDKQYAIGVFIGEMLPFVILIGLAYLFFYWAKKKRK
ncbi:MAG: hypothetical protein L3J45_08525 [Flavobacteriaceae bacterium]|nr:hypothetical protein [Flavobacteriaceae bacterium]